VLVMSKVSCSCRRDHPVDSPEKGAREAAERTGGEAEGEPRTEAGAGSPKGNTGGRAAGCGSPPPRHRAEKGDGCGLAAIQEIW